MIQIFLDGKIAIPRDNASIKLTTENPYFTKSASYTYDVELPLGVTENREIFGWLSRMDESKQARILEARLVVDNVTVLTGTAHITSVSDTSVKVQLLGEASSYNYGNKMDDTFIDELDLGDWYGVTWPDLSYWSGGRGRDNVSNAEWKHYPEGTRFRGTCDSVFHRANYTPNNGYDHDGLTMLNNLFSGEYPWVAYPVINSTADIICNEYAYRFTSSANTSVEFFLRGYDGEKSYNKVPSEDSPVSSYSVQPYIWKMAELIATATGFTLPKSKNALYKDDLFNKIFIVNANNFIECNKCLPHWSVNEWWTQIEQTFGLVMTINYTEREIALTKRTDYYKKNSPVVELADIADEYSTDIDEDSETDISSGNTGFADYENGPEDLLSDFILKNATYIDDFDSITELVAWAKKQKYMSDFRNTVFRCHDGRHFIFSNSRSRFEEVNMFRPRILRQNNSDIDTELKFVPARFIDYDCNIYPHIVRNGVGGNVLTQDVPVGSFPVRVLQKPDTAEMDWYKDHYDDLIDIDAIINEEEDEGSVTTSSEDVIYMAVAVLPYRDKISASVSLKTGGKYTGVFDYPRAFLRSRVIAPMDATPSVEDPLCSLSLIQIDGQTSLAKETMPDNLKISTAVRYCIKFLCREIPTPGAIFLIHNKRFVCEKIEANISPNGLDKLLTGYFFELEL